jgi:hypothetical protein
VSILSLPPDQGGGSLPHPRPGRDRPQRATVTPTTDTNHPGRRCTQTDSGEHFMPGHRRCWTPWPCFASKRSTRTHTLPRERRTNALEYCGMLTSTLVASVVGAAVGSVVTVLLQNCRGLWLSLRKVKRWLTYRTGQWWTRNWGYIPRCWRSPNYRDAPWWNTGPYWLNSPPTGYPVDGRGPRDLLGRPMRPDRAGIVPYSR